MRRRFEKPQEGNPHQLTVRQHVFPRASIVRFACDGRVDLLDLGRKLRRPARPDDALFCAGRAWAHGPEAGWMKEKEDAFQVTTEAILRDQPTSLDQDQAAVITEFYTLWHVRARLRHLTRSQMTVLEYEPRQLIPVRLQHIGRLGEGDAAEPEELQ